MYSTTQIQVNQGHALYTYCEEMTKAANNLSNAVLFRMRQVMTAVNKSFEQWTENECRVMAEVKLAVEASNNKFHFPQKKKWNLSYPFLDFLLKITHNPDYLCSYLPRQSAQQIIKTICQDMKSFFKSLKSYQKTPNKFCGKPKLPNYKKSGGKQTVYLTNQDCVLKERKGELISVKLPLTKLQVLIPYPSGRLKSVAIKPTHGIYLLCFTFETAEEVPALAKESKHIASIDLGVSNFAAITNNLGKPCLLFKGGIIKSVNQLYNKKIAKIISEQTKGTTNKFIPNAAYQEITRYRNSFMSDYLHKTAKRIIDWCIENTIDTLVVGVNKGWKQEVNMGKNANQNFVQIPYTHFKQMLSYLCERNGIRYIEQEESYTSKASFLDQDKIPVYDAKNTTTYTFSGKRFSRGNYRTKDKKIINADLNGSANIARKALSEQFLAGQAPNFEQVILIHHPDEAFIVGNRLKQKSKNKGISKSKQKRIAKKAKRVAK